MKFERFERSLQERARHYVKTREYRRLISELRLPDSCRADLETLQMLASVQAHLGRDVDILVDVGAHRGRFAAPAFHVLQAKYAICFEPNPEVLPALKAELASLKAEIHNCALSDKEGSSLLHIHEDASMTSLLLSDRDILKRDFATYDAERMRDIRVPVSTLDLMLSKYAGAGRRFFIKLDTQGNELSVLHGAGKIMGQCDGILTEYMFTTPYEGQPSFEALTEFLRDMGFRCSAVVDVKRKRSHRISGVDFLFLPEGRQSESRPHETSQSA